VISTAGISQATIGGRRNSTIRGGSLNNTVLENCELSFQTVTQGKSIPSPLLAPSSHPRRLMFTTEPLAGLPLNPPDGQWPPQKKSLRWSKSPPEAYAIFVSQLRAIL
jgi:hypothetical protein